MPTTANRSQVSTAGLKRMLDGEENFVLLDVRNDDEFARWKIEGRHTPRTIHLPYFAILEDPQGTTAHIPRDQPIVVVCAKGGSSAWVADDVLRPGGYDVANLEGGMVAWGSYYDLHQVREAVAPLRIWQLERPSRGCLHYIIAYGNDSQFGIVIDPPRHLEPVMDLARGESFRITHIIDTHAHADHISGGPALSKDTGAPYYLHPYDGVHPLDVLPATIPFEWLHDRHEFDLGSARLRAIHVPGHTLGTTALLLTSQRGEFLFSGDTVFIRSIARPDLGGRGEVWAPLHFHSIRDRLLSLRDDTLVLPGHFSSPDEARSDGIYAGTLGTLKRNNSELAPRTEAEFVRHIISSLPQFPPQYADIKRVNAGLLQADEELANELKMGRNICALTGAYASREENDASKSPSQGVIQ